MEKLPVEKSPWTILDTEIKLDTPWIRVKLHNVLIPSGAPGIYGVTEFKSLAIGILPIDKEGYTYLVGQYRFPIEQYSWEIPEGGAPLDEDPLLAAKRELSEETGLSAENWELIQTLHTSNSATNEYARLYLATDIKVGESHPEPEERLQVKRIHFDEAYQRVKSGEITDSLTVAAVLRYKIHLMERFLT